MRPCRCLQTVGWLYCTMHSTMMHVLCMRQSITKCLHNFKFKIAIWRRKMVGEMHWKLVDVWVCRCAKQVFWTSWMLPLIYYLTIHTVSNRNSITKLSKIWYFVLILSSFRPCAEIRQHGKCSFSTKSAPAFVNSVFASSLVGALLAFYAQSGESEHFCGH